MSNPNVPPLPDSVCADLCATRRGVPHRTGTNLLSFVEAKQMLEHVLTLHHKQEPIAERLEAAGLLTHVDNCMPVDGAKGGGK